jgi:GNAT superfamily N-acetyltransferase
MLSRLKIGSSTNEESHISMTTTSEYGAKLRRSISDESSESDDDDTHGSDVALSSSPATRTSSTATLNLTYRLVICTKTQHFSKGYVVFANTSDYGKAGQIKARYINLFLIKASMSESKATLQSNLYSRVQDLNDGSSDGLAFAKAILCPKGKLKKEIFSNGNHSLEPWGIGLESGPVLILQVVFIKREFWRQGVATLLLQALINRCKKTTGKTEKSKIKFRIVYPAVVKEDFENELEGKREAEKKEIEKGHYKIAVDFYRANGFRRIG